MVDVVSFNHWIDGRELHSIGTNHKSEPLPFQSWQKFKEAFAPELVASALRGSDAPVSTVLDPFGGSGTTALAAQFLGAHPVTVEVNPYLADLIESKLTNYDLPSLARELKGLIDRLPSLAQSAKAGTRTEAFDPLPPSFIQSEQSERWIFSLETAHFLLGVRTLIDEIPDPNIRRIARVVLGGTLVGLSNVRVSGKGRRYRGGWRQTQKSPDVAAKTVEVALLTALDEVTRYNERECNSFDLIRGDSRVVLKDLPEINLSIFSPPYPNSFDYTDVYNVELWMLGYLAKRDDNKDLRLATLTSHVQVKRDYSPAPEGSPTLLAKLEALELKRTELWNATIPEMIGAYFADMRSILIDVQTSLTVGGQVWMVVGDSRYAGVDIPVATILRELAHSDGYEIIRDKPFRSMRSSPQQGGRLELAESLVVLRKA